MSAKKIIGFTALALLVVALCVGFVNALTNAAQNQCLVENPRQVVGGKFERWGNLWGEEIILHRLFYSGKMSKTNKVCESWLYVTREEYEQWMYK